MPKDIDAVAGDRVAMREVYLDKLCIPNRSIVSIVNMENSCSLVLDHVSGSHSRTAEKLNELCNTKPF